MKALQSPCNYSAAVSTTIRECNKNIFRPSKSAIIRLYILYILRNAKSLPWHGYQFSEHSLAQLDQ